MLSSIFNYFSGAADGETATANTPTEERTEEEKMMTNSVSEAKLSTSDTAAPVTLLIFKDFDPNYNGRDNLPANMLQREQISVWSILKQSIGKELSKITMPVVFNEPLSFLQRITEYMEYCDILKKASEQSDPVKRMEYVAAFAVSSLASNWDRVAKPFNPLLGETYELDRREDLGFRIVCEQVSHHPPVSAFHADSPVFKFHGTIYPKLKFWGRSIEIQPRGIITLELIQHQEIYTWTNVNCSVHNLVMGKMYIEQHGFLEIMNHVNGLKCTLNFKPTSSWFGKDCSNHIEGFITGKNKEKLRAMYGTWTDFFASCSVSTFEACFSLWGKEHKDHKKKESEKLSRAATIDHSESAPEMNSSVSHFSTLPVLSGSEVLWRVKPRPASSEKFYNFTLFAFLLNQQREDAKVKLPCTDSRFRPDMRKMEDGDWDGAAEEKHRLEEKQRAVRAVRKKDKSSGEWEPLWFRSGRHHLVKEDTWHFNDQYWNREWSKSPNIF